MSPLCNGSTAGLWNRSKRIWIPVTLLCSLSDKYPLERYEPPYPPNYGLNSTTTIHHLKKKIIRFCDNLLRMWFIRRKKNFFRSLKLISVDKTLLFIASDQDLIDEHGKFH